MLNKFGNVAQNVGPILDLMKSETQNVTNSLQTGNMTGLANTVDRLTLLTSRLYSEYLIGKDQFKEDPSLLNEALAVLTKSQEASLMAKTQLDQQQVAKNIESAEKTEEPFLIKLERRVSLFAAVGIPSAMYFFSKDMPTWKQYTVRGLAVVGGVVALRNYTKK